jgi:hypothetical protein
MKARQLIGGSAFLPDELKVIFEAFDDAGTELASEVGTDLNSIDLARVSLATRCPFQNSSTTCSLVEPPYRGSSSDQPFVPPSPDTPFRVRNSALRKKKFGYSRSWNWSARKSCDAG